MAKAASKSSPQRKYLLKQPFSLFLCISCTSTPETSSSSKNTNHAARICWQSFPFLWYDYVSTDDEHWHITIEQLLQTARSYTLSVVQHKQRTTSDATILIINAIICYSKQWLVTNTFRNLFCGNSRKCLNHYFSQ